MAHADFRFDFIVCGSGSSGSVVAGRLAEKGASVLLLEAGGRDDTELVAHPNNWVRTIGSDLDWGFRAEKNLNLNDRTISYSMGKVLGGGSSINVGTWSRGHKTDWDGFALAAKDDRWSYEAVKAIYRDRVEDWQGKGDENYRGRNGPVFIQPSGEPHPFTDAVLQSYQDAGIPCFDNSGGTLMESPSGCAVIDEIVRDGQRMSVYRAYAARHEKASRLTVLTGTTVCKVRFDGHHARWVDFLHDGKSLVAEAGLKIILSMGAIQTPKVMMLSGLGDAKLLRRHDISVVQHLSGVGQNLHDHVAIGVIFEGTGAAIPAVPRAKSVAFWKTREQQPAPNFYAYPRIGAAGSPENLRELALPSHTWSFATGMRPKSRGQIQLSGPHPEAAPIINANYLSEPSDIDELRLGIEVARAVGNGFALRNFTKKDLLPSKVQELGPFIRNGLTTFWHQCGTARMGHSGDGSAVVDGSLHVFGVEGLMVADASIMPFVTVGNTMAPCVIIGEQAAEILIGEFRL